MIRGAVLLAGVAVALGGCVPVVRYSPLTPSAVSAHAAVEAGANLSLDRWAGIYTQIVTDDQGRPAYGPRSRRLPPFQMCARDGRRIDGHSPRIAEDAICVTEAQGVETCYRHEDLQSIGRPRDGTAIGYYSVPIMMKCRPA